MITDTAVRGWVARLWPLFVEEAAKVLDAEQERLSAEGYLMDSDDCIQTLREAAEQLAADAGSGNGDHQPGDTVSHPAPAAPSMKLAGEIEAIASGNPYTAPQRVGEIEPTAWLVTATKDAPGHDKPYRVLKFTLGEAVKQAEHLRDVGCAVTMEPLGRIAVPGPENRVDSPQSEYSSPRRCQRRRMICQ